MKKTENYEMTIRLSNKKTAACELCKGAPQSDEIYIFRKNGNGHYLCRKHIEELLMIAALSED
ncbi:MULTISPECIES: hypothetical protein [Eisenbergiella]|uniref:Uncharacterized protein n=1 Tax=Eisenbergiella porci TaxID=2652274 RepID=A0A6N7WPI0_9FIRM|nr:MULTISPECIES: hypothetical protein [Eisenbergiella]MDY2654998.1 hypothetical protein [Eisenbergiella porci]MSS91358.1 hypothetical protein [Eisenbergiella porci]